MQILVLQKRGFFRHDLERIYIGLNWKILFCHGRAFSRLLYSYLGTWACLNILVIGYKEFHSPFQTSIAIEVFKSKYYRNLTNYLKAKEGINRVPTKWEIQLNNQFYRINFG